MAEALTNQAYEYLYNKIISCEYRPGQELNEKQLLEETKFGRTPLREALLMLQSENLIEIFPRKGMRITAFTEKSIDDLYQTRKLIEPTVCRKYITLYSKSKLLEFQKMFERAEKASDVEEFRIDTSFHSYLISITDNQILINMYHSVMIHQMRLAVYAAMLDASNRIGNLQQHKAIIDALLRENEEDVQDAIVLHINHSLIKSLKLLRNSEK
ncbi:GntR family transcriptional regulator [Enterocloster asparagiformis]|uniref:GntR family transcriptional regulator n=1 Tax=Enterocloster asparagiformis TaxID=333367 RepID=UPI002A81AED5|nr:GntR family transcriptional regulator [Enterocloster asparagiformis]